MQVETVNVSDISLTSTKLDLSNIIARNNKRRILLIDGLNQFFR